MKVSSVASLLFAGAALAMPVVEKRAVETEVVVTTIWTTTTVFLDGATRGVFAEQVSSSASSSASSTSSTTTPPPPPPTSTAAPAAQAVAAVASVAAPVVAAPAVAAPAAAAAAAPASAQKFVGESTYYTVSNGVAGSCGSTKTDNDFVVALSVLTMKNGANSNHNPLCGKTVTIKGEKSTYTAEIYDSCEGCKANDIDLSPSLFKAAFPNGDGRVHNVEWWINN